MLGSYAMSVEANEGSESDFSRPPQKECALKGTIEMYDVTT